MHTNDANSSRLISRIFDESDIATIGSQIIRYARIAQPDGATLASAMHMAYARMQEDQGATPSPVLPTYLGLQSTAHFDAIEIGDGQASKGVVIFLHGWLGSFTLPCWQISQAARTAQHATICPSMGWKADWWSPDGQIVVKEVIQSLHKKGVSRIYLAGLSNGALGALSYAQRNPTDLKGLILISGARRGVTSIAIPALVLQGKHDPQFPPAIAREFARRVGARYIDLDAGHFAMLIKEQEANAAISKWLNEQN